MLAGDFLRGSKICILLCLLHINAASKITNEGDVESRINNERGAEGKPDEAALELLLQPGISVPVALGLRPRQQCGGCYPGNLPPALRCIRLPCRVVMDRP